MSQTEEKYYICIDLKSFFASVECSDRGLDPFKTNLVVADERRTSGAICLAITPAMKKQGVKNRCRLFEIPSNMKYMIVAPRMQRYMEVSAQIYGIYLTYISADDILPYSIDECFIDVTSYLMMYGMTPRQLAERLMQAVLDETGIYATAGIGTNMFLAKLALDITAKKVPDGIGYLDKSEFKRLIWHHRPITDVWNIGPGIARRLEKYGVFDLAGITRMDESILYKEFGVNAEFIIDHAHGIEACTIADINEFKPKSKSISHGQVLGCAVTRENAWLLIKEMIDSMCLELVQKNLMTKGIALTISYEHKYNLGHTGGTRRLEAYTDSYSQLSEAFGRLFEETADHRAMIKKLNLAMTDLLPYNMAAAEFDMFADTEKQEKERRLQQAVAGIKDKFGKNILLRAMSLQEEAKARERNTLVGGHRG